MEDTVFDGPFQINTSRSITVRHGNITVSCDTLTGKVRLPVDIDWSQADSLAMALNRLVLAYMKNEN